MSRERAAHATEMRLRAMKTALSMSDLDLSDALAVIEQIETLIRYLHRQPGANVVDLDIPVRGRS